MWVPPPFYVVEDCLRRPRQLLRMHKPHVDVDDELQRERASAVQQHIPDGRAAIGQKALVPLVAACNGGGAEHGERHVCEVARAGQREP